MCPEAVSSDAETIVKKAKYDIKYVVVYVIHSFKPIMTIGLRNYGSSNVKPVDI